MNEDERNDLINRVFFPFYWDRVDNLTSTSKRLVHYTSASAALSILQKKKIWMRNVSVMNDYQEVKYGAEQFKNLRTSPQFDDFKAAFGDKADAFVKAFDFAIAQFPEWEQSTYISCLSEHENDEDELGRLSMWRGYGKGAGLAIVLRPNIFVSDFDVFHISTSPVEYMTHSDFKNGINRLIHNIKDAHDIIAVISGNDLQYRIENLIKFAVLSMKHPGFKEEKEWRIIADINEVSEMNQAIIDVNGVPQRILMIPLSDKMEDGKDGFSINKNLDRIIIGPTPYPTVIKEAIVEELKKCNVEHPEKKVFVSDIPYRQ